ncbi:panoramix [Cochliomyia hominivorax]
MNSECNQVEIKDEDEDLRSTPERPAFSPLTQETNDQNEEVNRTDSNGMRPEVISENFSTNEVEVKQEIDLAEANAIDYGMPISKTPVKNNSSQLTDMDTSRLLAARAELSTGTMDQTQLEILNANLAKVATLNETQAKTALDAVLDGIATPLAPSGSSLRVKNEFALLPPTPAKDDSDKQSNPPEDMDISPPPPPPLFISSTTTGDSLTDGIATPRLSLAAVNRLRVKTEFNINSRTLDDTAQDNEDSNSQPDDNFFADLLPKEDIKTEVGEGDEEDEIPPDFFDDLTHDKIEERIEEAKNCELEEKFSDRLKLLKRLEQEEKEKRKHHKKAKKSKKKSHKRSRSRSLSPPARKAKKYDDLEDRNNYEFRQHEMPSGSHQGDEEITFMVRDTRVKSEFGEHELNNEIKVHYSRVENVEEIVENLTPKQKKERAIRRATALLNHLKDSAEKDSTIFSTFSFVSTVRKLPTSHSYVQQQIYENRSPLHTVNNVSYKFNSYTSRFNMEEWGLKALPAQAAKLAKLVGCDAQFIHNKLKTIKIPAKLKKIKQEPNVQDINEEEEELIESTSSLYANAMTQTDDTGEFEGLRKVKYYEIGVQAQPQVYSIGSQTLETQSPTKDGHKEDEAPIMNIIKDLNENQLMAIHAFAELIKIPNTNTSAMDLYKIQIQIMDIYKMSQLPSVLAPQQSQSLNNYSTNITRNTSPPRRREIPQQDSPLMHIKSVQGADGTEFVMNDPRAKSAAYAKRIVANDGAGTSSFSANYDNRHSGFSIANDGAGTSSFSANYDNRHSAFSQQHQNQSRALANESYSANSTRSFERSYGNERSYGQNQYPLKNAVPPATTKRYGRGAARR